MHPLALLLKEHEGWLVRRSGLRCRRSITAILHRLRRLASLGRWLTDSICAALELSSDPWNWA